MHASSDPRVVKFLDGIHMSFLFLDYLYSDLYQVCLRIEENNANVAAAFWRCWSFVDVVHRLRELTQAVPGLNMRTSEVKTFLAQTAVAEQFRHYIQHLRGEASGRPGNDFPVWGSLAWVDPNDPMACKTVLAGARVGLTRYPGLPFNMDIETWLTRVSLSIEDLSFDFDPIYAACTTFREFVIPWMIANFAPGIEIEPELTIVTAKVVLT